MALAPLSLNVNNLFPSGTQLFCTAVYVKLHSVLVFKHRQSTHQSFQNVVGESLSDNAKIISSSGRQQEIENL